MRLDNRAYKKAKKEERHLRKILYYTCNECGIISKEMLKYAHPTKIGCVCEKCRDKLYG